MIKLIVSDIDGTLVRDGSCSLDPAYGCVIRALREKGIRFVAASGRHRSSVEAVMGALSGCVSVIGDNGAFAADETGRELLSRELDAAEAAEIIRMMRAIPGAEAVISTPEDVVCECRDEKFLRWMRDGYHNRMRVTEDAALEPRILKVSVCALDGRIADSEYGREIVKRYGNRYQVHTAGSMWMDINAKEAGKENAVETLQKYFGVAPEETMCFGDQENDIGMMQRAYYSFAVENAIPAAREAARFLADRNTENGVLKILKCLL